MSKFLGDFDPTYMDRSRPKGPDFLIMDNFFDYFENFIEKTDMMSARSEAEELTS